MLLLQETRQQQQQKSSPISPTSSTLFLSLQSLLSSPPPLPPYLPPHLTFSSFPLPDSLYKVPCKLELLYGIPENQSFAKNSLPVSILHTNEQQHTTNLHSDHSTTFTHTLLCVTLHALSGKFGGFIQTCYTRLHLHIQCYIVMLRNITWGETMLRGTTMLVLYNATQCYMHYTMLHALHNVTCITQCYMCYTMSLNKITTYLRTDVISSRTFMSTRTQAKLSECEMRSRSATNSMICVLVTYLTQTKS